MGENPSQRIARGTPFRQLQPPLSEECLSILDSKGMIRTTPVQAATIPLFCTNKDVAVEAVTGSGKTLAFILPMIEMLRKIDPPLKPHQVGAIIISPTRELAAQIANVSSEFVSTIPHLHQALLVGGTSVTADCASLSSNGANVLIGTPGRLDDILERFSSIDIRTLEVLVLDEADRLLDMGFSIQLSSIMSKLPKQRRTGLFSATQTHAVKELALAGMRNPVRVEVHVRHAMDIDHHHNQHTNQNILPSSSSSSAPAAPATATASSSLLTAQQSNGDEQSQNLSLFSRSKIPVGLNIQYMICEVEEKPSQLLSFLAKNSKLKILVFVLTCACVDYWTLILSQFPSLKNTSILPLHGKMNQINRESSLNKFLSLSNGILICTDVAARGLDIPNVNWIVQFDPPQDPKAFVHRAGRTARMGNEGNALVFLIPQEDSYVEYLKLQNIPMKEMKKEEINTITEDLRKEAIKDRDVFEKGLKAFVSFVRGYKEHHCNFIFNWRELELGRLGMSFGMLFLPSMPEIRRKPKMALGFIPIPNLDTEKIKFKDKGREKQRKMNLKTKENKNDLKSKSKKGTVKEMMKKEEKKSLKRKKESKKLASNVHGGGEVLFEEEEEEDDDDDDLENDYRALRKLKKGVITEEEFENVVGISGGEEDNDNDSDNDNDGNDNNDNDGNDNNDNDMNESGKEEVDDLNLLTNNNKDHNLKTFVKKNNLHDFTEGRLNGMSGKGKKKKMKKDKMKKMNKKKKLK